MKTTHDEVDLVLRVLARDEVAEGVVHLVLGHPDGQPLPVWQPGAHIDLNYEDLTRQYSLTGDPSDRSTWRLAVLRDKASRGGSVWVHDSLHEGADVMVRGPRNHFPLEPAQEYLFIAGGIGITPIVAMAYEASVAGIPWRLVYGGRQRSSMAFVAELMALADASPAPAVVEVLPEDEMGLLPLAEVLADPRPGVAIYACGPEPLLQAVEAASTHWPAGALHVERFTAKPVAAEPVAESFEIEIASTGEVLTVPPDKSVLDVLRAAGYNVLSSCQEGTCGTCETIVISGQVEHRDSILTDEEKQANESMFVCVSRSAGTRIVLDL